MIASYPFGSLFINANTLWNIFLCCSFNKTLLQWLILENFSSKLMRGNSPTLFSSFRNIRFGTRERNSGVSAVLFSNFFHDSGDFVDYFFTGCLH